MEFWASLNEWVSGHQVLVASVVIPLITVLTSVFASWSSARSNKYAIAAQLRIQNAAIAKERIQKMEAAVAECVASMNRLHTLMQGMRLEASEDAIEEAKAIHQVLPRMVANLKLAFPGEGAAQLELATLLTQAMNGIGTTNPSVSPDDILRFVQRKALDEKLIRDNLLDTGRNHQ